MRVRTRDLLIGTVAAGVALAPALAFSQGPASGSFTAVDYAWRANGGAATSLSVTAGSTVAFAYPAGASWHNVSFGARTPTSCQDVPSESELAGPPWEGSCTFETAGTYTFRCGVHPEMVGQVVVEPAAATPTPTPAGGLTPTATAQPGATPAAGSGPAESRQTSLKRAVKLAATQRGTRVRGTVAVGRAKSRLAVTLTARLAPGGKRVRVGRLVRPSVRAGDVAFSVALDAPARRALRRDRRLAVTVTIALTPPGGARLTRTLHAKLRPG